MSQNIKHNDYLNNDCDGIENDLEILEKKIKIQEQRIDPNQATLLTQFDRLEKKLENFRNDIDRTAQKDEKRYWEKYVRRQIEPAMERAKFRITALNPSKDQAQLENSEAAMNLARGLNKDTNKRLDNAIDMLEKTDEIADRAIAKLKEQTDQMRNWQEDLFDIRGNLSKVRGITQSMMLRECGGSWATRICGVLALLTFICFICLLACVPGFADAASGYCNARERNAES